MFLNSCNMGLLQQFLFNFLNVKCKIFAQLTRRNLEKMYSKDPKKEGRKRRGEKFSEKNSL